MISPLRRLRAAVRRRGMPAQPVATVNVVAPAGDAAVDGPAAAAAPTAPDAEPGRRIEAAQRRLKATIPSPED